MTVRVKKAFDCVAMKRRGSLRIYRATRGMNATEALAYWQRKDRDLLAEQTGLKVRGSAVRRHRKTSKRA